MMLQTLWDTLALRRFVLLDGLEASVARKLPADETSQVSTALSASLPLSLGLCGRLPAC